MQEDVHASAWLPSMRLGLYEKLSRTQYAHYVSVYNNVRFSHTWVLGKTGYGKSTALENWAIEDILNGDGVAFFDPHGDSIDTILLHIPPERQNDVVLFDLSDRNYPIGLNVLHGVSEIDRPFVASSIVDTFKSIWADSWGPQLEQLLYNGVAALIEVPDGTLVGLKYLLTSARYRKEVLTFVTDSVIRDFWKTDFEIHMPEREQRQRTLSTLNKIGALISDPRVRNVIGQPVSTLRLSTILEQNQILLVKLPQGKLGIQKAALVGALLMGQLHLAGLARCSVKPFHIYADEAHHFGTRSLEEMLSGIRKRHISLTLAHQYVDQLSPTLKSALLGTVGTVVAFRLGARDALELQSEFLIPSNDYTLQSLRRYSSYARSDGEIWSLFMPDIDSRSFADAPMHIRSLSRKAYGNQRSQVEKRLNRFIDAT